MAKITISLPDPLKDRLEQYAQEHQLPISQAVQKALETFLAAPEPIPIPVPPPEPPPPAPPPTPGPPANLELFRRISNLERYVTTLAGNHNQVRDCVGMVAIYVAGPGSATLPLPPDLPPPPWQH